MPWEKSFNEELAIEQAMLVFWQQGYNETSMAQLLDVTKLTKGSFYNAFGSKKALFLRALQKYDLEYRTALLQKFIALDNPVLAIESLFEHLIKDSSQPSVSKGCFIINISINLYAYDADIRNIVTQAINEIEIFFKQMIEIGQRRATIKSSIDPSRTAKSLTAALVAIRVLSRGTYTTDSLRAVADQATLNLQATSY